MPTSSYLQVMLARAFEWSGHPRHSSAGNMEELEELKNVSPLRSPSMRSSRALESSRASARSLVHSPTARSGRTSPLPEMCVTEQIARQTRKSTVLDPKNALLILAIPDYDDYKIMQPYSCRSLSNKSKFIGGKDFVTRHNPQEVNDFKMQYSRDVGNLNRHRSVLAPPNTSLMPSLNRSPTNGSSKSFALAGLQSMASISGNQLRDEADNAIWKKVLTADKKPFWILTEYGIDKLIGPEYRITTRVSMTTAREEPSPLTCRSPLRPKTPLDAFAARDSARIGMGVSLNDEGSLSALSRTAMYSPDSRPPSPLRSPYREPLLQPPTPLRSPGTGLSRVPDSLVTDRSRVPTSPTIRSRDIFHLDTSPLSVASPTLLPFAMEISPPHISLKHLSVGEVYIFPVRVRNVGSKQERFRVKYVSASVGTHLATIAEANYDKDSARLAPGLAAIITVTLCFGHRGQISGAIEVDTEGVGSCEVAISGSVR